MGLKRLVFSMLRSGPRRTLKVGELPAGFPPVFNEDGMWIAQKQRQVQVTASNSPRNLQEHDLEQQSGHKVEKTADIYRLPRKRSWLAKRMDPVLLEK